ncbi:MAG TPA: alpha/beta hydrolase-fold protein [Candidatus Dormibacteraeota bacterium]
MIKVDTIQSRQLTGNLLGNETQRDLVVYLPPSYSEMGDRRYPVAYLLHGYSNRALYWPYGPALAFGALHPPIGEVIEEAVRDFHAEEMIVVMPDGWSRWGCSQWVDSPVTGNFESYVIQEVVAHVDKNYRTLPQAQSRGVFGISSGGFGAWHLGSRNPDVFAAVSLLSADSYFEITHKPFFYQYYDRIFPNAPAGPIEGDIVSWMCYGLSQAYTPNPSKPPYYADFAVEYPSGQLNEEAWAKWIALDPVVSWEPRLANLRKLSGLLLDAGRNDEFDLHYGHRLLSKNLKGAGIKHDFEEHAGTHTSLMFERIKFSLGWFSQILQFS